MQPLSSRQQSILNRVVTSYIETAQPVGSRFLTELYTEIYRDSYSSATVRHELGILEERGYLMHPHTSAGRVPTDLGYRYYLDHGLCLQVLPLELIGRMTRDLMSARQETNPFVEKASQILSEMTEEVGMMLLPEKEQPRFALQGSTHILEKPEFRDLEKIRLILKTFEDKTQLVDWLEKRAAHGHSVTITIGRENEPPAFYDCAVVSTRYSAGSLGRGMLAVIGPRRMPYAKIVPLVQHMGRIIERILDLMGVE